MEAKPHMDNLKKEKISGNAAYVVFGESLISNLIQRQVLDVIVGLRTHLNVDKYYLLVFAKWDECLRRRARLRTIIKDLKRKGVICRLIPTPFSVPIYDFQEGWKMKMTYNPFTIPLVMLFTLPFMIFYVLSGNVRLFHCRSYLSSLPIPILKTLFKNITFIFDPRSDYPEETALQKNWSKNSIDYKFWKYLEKKYFENSDTVIAICETFDRHIKDIYVNAKSVVLHNNVDTYKFDYDEDFHSNYRKIKNIRDEIVFCYSGSLYRDRWNDPEIYARYVKYFHRECDFEVLFLFLTPEYCREALMRALQKYKIDMKYCLIESPKFEEIAKYLSVGDIGAYFLPYHSPRVGTKFVEYCSVGLPVIVNENVGGATHLVNEFKLGISINNIAVFEKSSGSNRKTIESIKKVIVEKEEYRKRCREFAEDTFSNRIVINKYACVYRNLL